MRRNTIKLSDLPAHVRAAAGLKDIPAKRGRIQVGSKEARTVDGVTFASIHEASVYGELKMLLKGVHMQLQPKFIILDGGNFGGKKIEPIRYIGDFLIGGKPRVADDEPLQDGQIVIDAKGTLTEEFRHKRKMFIARYKADIWLVGRDFLSVMEVLSRTNFLST